MKPKVKRKASGKQVAPMAKARETLPAKWAAENPDASWRPPPGETERRLRRRTMLTVALGAMATLACGAWYLWSHSGQNSLPFDRDEWRRHDWNQTGLSKRYRMVGSLLRQHQLVGMNRAEVEALLGPIEYESVNQRVPYPGWDLGQIEGWLLPHGTTLVVQFGADGRIVKVWNPGR